MPNTAQAKKRHRQDEERRLRNKIMRSRMRSAMKNVIAADSKESGQDALRAATKQIDKAAKQHIIHANSAARYKSRLAKRVATIEA